MEKKSWYKSKTIWASIITALIVAYNTVGPNFGLPVLPEFVYGALAALGLYGRSTSSTKVTL